MNVLTDIIQLYRIADNAPTQYACRQTFIQNASFQERHPGITIKHRLAVVDKFKGNHDAVGKDPIIKVRYLESIKIRPPTAWMVVSMLFQLGLRFNHIIYGT